MYKKIIKFQQKGVYKVWLSGKSLVVHWKIKNIDVTGKNIYMRSYRCNEEHGKVPVREYKKRKGIFVLTPVGKNHRSIA